MHLTEIEILLYIENKITGIKKSEIEEHLGECSECTSNLANMYIFTKDVIGTDAPEISEEIFNKAKSLVRNDNKKNMQVNKIPFPSFVFALSVLIVSVVTVLFYFTVQRGNSDFPKYRSENPASFNLSLFPTDGSELGSKYLNFSWNKINNAIEYKITIFDLDGNIVFNKSIQDTILNLDSQKYLSPGNTYLWNVLIYLPDGRSVKSSVQSFKFSQK